VIIVASAAILMVGVPVPGPTPPLMPVVFLVVGAIGVAVFVLGGRRGT
jgi:hypothetical protein